MQANFFILFIDDDIVNKIIDNKQHIPLKYLY